MSSFRFCRIVLTKSRIFPSCSQSALTTKNKPAVVALTTNLKSRSLSTNIMPSQVKREGKGTKTVFTLNTGAKMPGVGLGTWQSGPNQVRDAVKSALQAGYRHIDTAFAYGNESEVGQGIKDSGVPREEIWITTKLDNPWHKRVKEGIASSLKNLQVDYVDLYLMHWPSSTTPDDLKKHHDDWTFIDTW